MKVQHTRPSTALRIDSGGHPGSKSGDIILILLRAGALPASDKIHYLHAHHHFALLIHHFDEGADDATVGAGFGAARFQNCRAHGQFIAGKDRLVPAQRVTAGGTEIGDVGKMMFGVDAHHQRGGVPAAGDHTAVNTFLRGFFVNVVGERHEALGEIDDFLFVDFDRAEFMDGAGNVVFKVTVVGGS